MNIFSCCLGRSQPEESIFPQNPPSSPEDPSKIKKRYTFDEMMHIEAEEKAKRVSTKAVEVLKTKNK